MLSTIVNQTWLKYCFGYSFTLSSAQMIEQKTVGTNFFETILQSIPSLVVVVLGIVYVVAIVIKQLSKTYNAVQKDLLDVKKAKEDLEQKEIETDIKREELKK